MKKQRQPKAAFVASTYGHLEGFHLPFMKLLQSRGYAVHAYACPDGGEKFLLGAGVVCHDIPFQRNPFRKENVLSLRKLTDSFQREKFHMVHVHTPAAGVLGRIAAHRTAVPFVLYTAHGFHFFKGAPSRNWLLYYPLEWLMACYTDTIITINDEDYQRAKRFPVRRRVTYVPGVGLDIRYYQSRQLSGLHVRRLLGIDQEEFVVSCIAELIPRKNHLQLIEAVRKLIALGVRIRCLLVGIGEREEELRVKVKQRGIESHVHFLGSRHDIPDILSASDVCVLVSRQEGLPRAVMEAMAAGKPVVATKIRGNRDLIRDGENGYLVPVGDVDATAKALDTLYQHPELRDRMGRLSHERIQQYDLSRIVQEMADVYQLTADAMSG